MPDPEGTGRKILSRIDDLRFLSRKAGIYAEVELRIAERLDDGEPVTGPWIIETVKALQVQYGLVPLP